LIRWKKKERVANEMRKTEATPQKDKENTLPK
jgi:hypothetical protein